VRTASARLRLLALLGAVLATAVLVAGCGSSSDGTSTGGDGGTVTIAGDQHGFFGELEAILDQFPYQHWYVACVMREAKRFVDPAEAEELADLSEAERQKRTQQAVDKAQPGCEKTARATVDPNASSKEIDLLRQSSLPGIVGLAETNGMSSTQVECVESFFAKLPDQKIVELRNGTDKVREGILVSVFRPCAQLK
jgi:hypothetical protein